MKDILRHYGSDPREFRGSSHELRGRGHRFVVHMQHATQPLPDVYSYTAIRIAQPGDLDHIGKIMAPSEHATFQADVHMYEVSQLQLTDTQAKRRKLEVLELLPSGWTIYAVAFPQEKNRQFNQLRIADNSDGRFVLGKTLPIAPLSDVKRVCVPVYRFGQERTGVDEAVEQIVYNIGLAQASDENLPFQETHVRARKFLQETLGGDLMLLTAK